MSQADYEYACGHGYKPLEVLRDAAQALRSLEAKQATRCTCPDPKPDGWPLAHAHNCPRVAPKAAP